MKKVEYLGIRFEYAKDKLKSNLNSNHRKEKHFYKEYCMIGYLDTEPKALLTVRFYSSETTRIYCCFWSYNTIKNKESLYASDYVSGFGFHKESAAFARALLKSGIHTYGLDCAGDTAVENAMNLYVKEILNYNGKIYLHKAGA